MLIARIDVWMCLRWMKKKRGEKQKITRYSLYQLVIIMKYWAIVDAVKFRAVTQICVVIYEHWVGHRSPYNMLNTTIYQRSRLQWTAFVCEKCWKTGMWSASSMGHVCCQKLF